MSRSSKGVRSLGEQKAYLLRYVAKYYPRLQPIDSFIDERGAFVYCALSAKGKEWIIRLRLPSNAPEKAIPLFDCLTQGGVEIWRYSLDYRPNVPWGEQHRAHLFDFQGFHTVMIVVAGSPRDIIESATHLNGEPLMPELAAVLRTKVAYLWGMTTTVSKAERRSLARLSKTGLP